MNLDKLPKWAQEHIRDLQRERDTAVRALREYRDSQTSSAIYYDDLICTGEDKCPTPYRRYVQSQDIWVEKHGVKLHIQTLYGNTNDESLVLQWATGRGLTGEVAMIPISFQGVRLITKERMR